MHPLLAEIIACKDAPRIDVLRRWQQQLRDDIAPLVAAGEQAVAAFDQAAKDALQPDIWAALNGPQGSTKKKGGAA